MSKAKQPENTHQVCEKDEFPRTVKKQRVLGEAFLLLDRCAAQQSEYPFSCSISALLPGGYISMKAEPPQPALRASSQRLSLSLSPAAAAAALCAKAFNEC
jgi:hypothetical protein